MLSLCVDNFGTQFLFKLRHLRFKQLCQFRLLGVPGD